jgi:hypothetical protein
VPGTSGPNGGCNPIVNGAFETGDFIGWTIQDIDTPPVVTNSDAHSGKYSAFLGGHPPRFCDVGPETAGNTSFYQEFTVPPCGGTLSFWHWDCTTSIIEFEWQDAYITDTNNTILQTIFHQCDNLRAWIQQVVDVTPYAGQTVRIKFLVHQDGSENPAGMYVDDVTLLCGPTPTPTPTPIPSCTPRELLDNSGFETGSFNPGWLNQGAVITNTLSHSGTYSAFAGGNPPDSFCGKGSEPGGDRSFYQEFIVPASGGTLSFWHWDCTTSTIRSGWQDAYITDADGTVLQTIFHQCSNTQQWVQRTVDMTPFAGRSVAIKFRVHEDGSGNLTGMYVDDVSLPGCVAISCGKIYNIGGFTLGSVTNITRIYCMCSNTWTTGAPCPASLSGHAIGFWDGIIFVAGGFDGVSAVNTLYEYYIAGDNWTTGAPMPAPVYSAGFGVINGKLYVASGNDGASEVNTLYIYDIPTDTWSTGPPVPTPVTGPGSAVLNGKLYLFGGGAPFPMTTTITQIYDPVTNAWSTGPEMNVNRLWFYGDAVGTNKIVAPGGDQQPGAPINDNEQLTNGSWIMTAQVPYNARGAFVVSDGTFVYVGGGYDGTNVRSDLLRYDPIEDTWTKLAPSDDSHYLSPAVIGGYCGTPVPTPSEPPPTPTATATPTSTPTPTPRLTPTPRPRPTPRQRP